MMLFVNGVDATSGEYLIPPLTEHDLALAVQGMQLDRASTAELQGRHRRATESHLAPRHGIDPADLAQSGWGLVTARDADPAVLAALRPLLDHRRDQAARVADRRYREFTGTDGYRRDESKLEFQARHGAGPGPVDPDVMPYHLLIVGGPDEVPFEVQYQLDVQHSVGRLSFDSVEEYAAYARNVVAVEKARRTGPTDVCIFAPRTDGDMATTLSEEHLAQPLARALGQDEEHWRVSRLLGPQATKDALASLLAGGAPPEVLFTASHGIAFPSGHPMQTLSQGALLCQDWRGPEHGAVSADQWYGATDVHAHEADLTGMIAFFFACFGAGTPREDDFGRPGGNGGPLAPGPFVAGLPRALLGRDGGALAVVGHVDRAWGYSFQWPGAGDQTEVFRSSVGALGDGQPVGAALEYMGDRHAEIATELAHTLEMVRLGKRADDRALAALWTAYADSRNFIVLGDPAARLRQRVPASSATKHREVVRVRDDPGSTDAESATGAQGSPEIEVATFVTDDPSRVRVDPATGRLSGARQVLYSRVRSDGGAQHVVTVPSVGMVEGQAGDLPLADIHARLLEVSLGLQRSHTSRTESSQ